MNEAFGMYDDMMRGSLSLSVSVSIYEDMRETVICPKPRRLGFLGVNDPIQPLRWHVRRNSESSESEAGTDLLDIIYQKKGGHGAEECYGQIASSPPFFSGSPPSRVSNPLIQDVRFGDSKFSIPFSPHSISNPSGLPSSPSRLGGCVRSGFGDNATVVRIEGFNCLDRDGRNCSIPGLA